MAGRTRAARSQSGNQFWTPIPPAKGSKFPAETNQDPSVAFGRAIVVDTVGAPVPLEFRGAERSTA
jgi:hypothetical protein